MADDPLERLDAFPYRHRVRDVMVTPLAVAEPGMTLEAAAKLMAESRVSSLVTLDGKGRAAGILTERDILRALARDGAAAATDRVASFMSSPVHDIDADAFVYRALGRMTRLGLRHLVVAEPASRKAVGMLTARALLKLRVAYTLQLGDALDHAPDAAALGRVRAELPDLVARMLAEGLDGLNAAAVISRVYCDMTRRAAELAVESMRADGKGEAPAPWAMLMLGSGGRGESLLAPDQDNAIVHDGGKAADSWFAEVARRASDTLDAAGIPYCKGKVMASNPDWRRSLSGWKDEILAWLRVPDPQALLSAGTFLDFAPVHGDFELAARLRHFATEHAAGSPGFLGQLAAQIENHRAPIGLFGRFRTSEGRMDLKLGGLFTITCGARAMALSRGAEAVSTHDRLSAVRDSGALNEADMDNLAEAHRTVIGAVLDQQIADIAAGLEPSSRVDPARLKRRGRARLKDALRTLEGMATMTRDVVSTGARPRA